MLKTLSAKSCIASNSYSFTATMTSPLAPVKLNSKPNPPCRWTQILPYCKQYHLQSPQSKRRSSNQWKLSNFISNINTIIELALNPHGGVFGPILFIACLNSSLSSGCLIASSLASINSAVYFCGAPRSANATARFKAVWPPMTAQNVGTLLLDRLLH